VTKQIETLVGDIHDLLDGKSPLDGGLSKELAKGFGERMERLVKTRLLSAEKRTPRLSPSNIGKPCERDVWLSIHKPEGTEPLRAETRTKFLYGDIIEELLLFLCEAAGHKVEGRQDVVEIEGITGSRDAIIDGVLVDVKSAASPNFKKFKEGLTREVDNFGYIPQIQTYLEASQDDPLVTDKGRCAFLVMDKTLGHICLDIHQKIDLDVRAITRRKIEVMNNKDVVPERAFAAEPDGYFNKDRQFVPNGNMKLGTVCGYCANKYTCWRDVGLRTFLSSRGPMHFTKIVKEPKMPEVTYSEIANIEGLFE
jgi:hypothetical protein